MFSMYNMGGGIMDIPKENSKQVKAFEVYLKHRGNITISAIADMFGVSRPSVSGWAKKFKWDERVAEATGKNIVEACKRTDEYEIETIRTYKQIVKEGLATYVEGVKAGTIKVKSTKDAVQLMELGIRLLEVERDFLNIEHESLNEKTEIIFSIGEKLVDNDINDNNKSDAV